MRGSLTTHVMVYETDADGKRKRNPKRVPRHTLGGIYAVTCKCDECLENDSE